MSQALELVPLAVVMVAGPQIISAFFLALSKNWRRNSLAFLLGATVGITLAVSTTYLLATLFGADSAVERDAVGMTPFKWIVVGLLVFAGVSAFLNRKDTEPPAWMRRFVEARPKRVFVLGFLLLGVFPTDIMSSMVVGTRLARDGLPLIYYLPFLLATLLLLALPFLGVVFLGHRAKTVLPKARHWIGTNSWIVSEIVIVVLIGVTVS